MGPTNVYCDKEAVVNNSSLAVLTPKKKHLSIYPKVHESYAKGAVCIMYKPTEGNLADVCTKVLSAEEKRKKM